MSTAKVWHRKGSTPLAAGVRTNTCVAAGPRAQRGGAIMEEEQRVDPHNRELSHVEVALPSRVEVALPTKNEQATISAETRAGAGCGQHQRPAAPRRASRGRAGTSACSRACAARPRGAG